MIERFLSLKCRIECNSKKEENPNVNFKGEYFGG